MEADDSKQKGLEKAAVEGAAAETVQRYGSAAAEHYKAYNGSELTRNLKDISKGKINPQYEYANINQQAGFAAENKTVARLNAEKIINKEDGRYVRTDDIGSVNDPFVDVVMMDSNGNIVPGTSSQLKFVGKDAKGFVDYFEQKKGAKIKKYLSKDDLSIEVPKGMKDEIDEEIEKRIEKLKGELESANKNGNVDLAKKKLDQINELKGLKGRLKEGVVTKQEAVEARLNPELSTAKDVAKVAHRAGVSQMKYGAAISGTFSMIRNISSCMKGDESPEEAAKNIAVDTGQGAVVSYITAFSGTTIKGLMQRSKNVVVESLSKTNLASGIVNTTIDVAKSIHRYIKGEIDGAECIEEMGQNGFGELGSAVFSSIGIAVVPSSAPAVLSVVGGIVGASFGYMAAVAVYKELATALKEAKMAREERIQTERQCAEAINMIKEYRSEMNRVVSEYMSSHIKEFESCFALVDDAIAQNDVDGFIKGNAELQEFLGHEIQFTSKKEFDQLMTDDSVSFKL